MSRVAGHASQSGITIGQLAAYAGVTIKAIRHYHQRGLLEEPERDASGYRRYDARHAVALVKIKTLADAGVPLARIKELIAAAPERFAAAIAEIDGELLQRTEKLSLARERIAQLSAGDRLFVSADVADYLDQLLELGVSARGVRVERDLWILMQSISPEQAAAWFADKREAMRDPEFRALCVEFDAAYDWSEDDPRLEPLAERATRWLAKGHASARASAAGDKRLNGMVAMLVDVSSPAVARLNAIAKERWKARPPDEDR